MLEGNHFGYCLDFSLTMGMNNSMAFNISSLIVDQTKSTSLDWKHSLKSELSR